MSEYRPIAPSKNADQSSGGSSSSKPGGLFGESSGGTSGGGSATGGQDSRQRRRRNTGQVSQIACTECRRARAKCDGNRPDSCSRCRSRGAKCVYEPHTKTHKDDLLKEIDVLKAEKAGLQSEHQGLQNTTKGLTEDKEDLQKQSDDQSVILDILTNNGHDREVVRRLRTGESRESVSDWLLSEPSLSRHLQTIPSSKRGLLDVVDRVESLYEEHPDPYLLPTDPDHQWTTVTKSSSLMRHLMVLYFTWVHPVHMLFSEVEFKESLSSGNRTYCSAPLVNAICAMACHLLDNQGPYARSRDVDAGQLKEGFMKEARAGLSNESYTLMTSIQAFAVMYLADLSSGKARSASGYLRCAADHLRKADRTQQSEEAFELSRWGIQTVNTAWSGIIYQKPYAPESPKIEVFLNVPLDKDADQWRYYRQQGDEQDIPMRPSHAVLTAYHQAKLFRIVHNNVNIFCGVRGKVTAQAVIECYKRYADWLDDLPPEIKNTDVGSQSLPHVLFLHIQYHTALVQLFTPLVLCQQFSGPELSEIRTIIASHARTGLNILDQSRRLYSCRYHMPLMSFCTVHLGHAMMVHSRDQPPASQTLGFCLNVLQEGQPGLPICGPLQQMLCKTANDLDVPLPDDIEEKLGSSSRYSVDDLLDACTRLSYAQPTDEIVRYIDTSIARDWSDEWKKTLPQQKGKYMQINALLND